VVGLLPSYQIPDLAQLGVLERHLLAVAGAGVAQAALKAVARPPSVQVGPTRSGRSRLGQLCGVFSAGAAPRRSPAHRRIDRAFEAHLYQEPCRHDDSMARPIETWTARPASPDLEHHPFDQLVVGQLEQALGYQAWEVAIGYPDA